MLPTYLASQKLDVGTHKSAGVIIPDSLGVAEGLQDRVGEKQQVLYSLNLVHLLGDVGNVSHDDLGSFGLSGSALT